MDYEELTEKLIEAIRRFVENMEKAEKADLTLSVSVPEEEIFILSDGRLLWRVFDNLLNILFPIHDALCTQIHKIISFRINST